MKHFFIFIIVMMIITSCKQSSHHDDFGKGGENAIQFVREQVPSQIENIAKMEVIEEDSLLSDIALVFERVRFAKAGADFWEGKISREDYRRIIDERAQLLQDIQYSWQFPTVINDSLKGIGKFNGMWRKVYKVRVTMKSGVTREPRVMMDEDGVTPRIIERDFEKELDEYQREILQANEDCIFGR